MNKFRHWYYYLTSPLYRLWVRTNEIQEMNNQMANMLQELISRKFCPHVIVSSGIDINHSCDCE